MNHSIKKLSALPMILGFLVRQTPNFRGKWRLEAWLDSIIKSKAYWTVCSLKGGEKLLLHLEDWIPYQVFMMGEYRSETIVQRYMLQYLKPGMTIFDIGANIGYYTVQFASRIGPIGTVHAFEPVSSTFALLQKNIILNGNTNVIANQLVLAESNGQRVIFLSGRDNTGRSSLIQPTSGSIGQTEIVEAKTVDQYLSEKNVFHIDIVKIDVEGSELAVLQGMTDLLSKPDAPTLFVEINSITLARFGVKPIQVIEYLEKYGYTPYKITATGPRYCRKLVDESLALFTKTAPASF